MLKETMCNPAFSVASVQDQHSWMLAQFMVVERVDTTCCCLRIVDVCQTRYKKWCSNLGSPWSRNRFSMGHLWIFHMDCFDSCTPPSRVEVCKPNSNASNPTFPTLSSPKPVKASLRERHLEIDSSGTRRTAAWGKWTFMPWWKRRAWLSHYYSLNIPMFSSCQNDFKWISAHKSDSVSPKQAKCWRFPLLSFAF